MQVNDPPIQEDGEARELREDEQLALVPMPEPRPQSVLSDEEQEASFLRFKARYMRERAAELEAEASSLEEKA